MCPVTIEVPTPPLFPQIEVTVKAVGNVVSDDNCCSDEFDECAAELLNVDGGGYLAIVVMEGVRVAVELSLLPQ